MGQTKKDLLELRKLELEIKEKEIAVERSLRYQRDDLLRIVNFVRPVGSSSVSHCMKELGQLFRDNPTSPIEIVFNSPGGSVFDGLALIDYIGLLQSEGCTINTSCVGMAASMGGVLLQAGEVRSMTANAYMMIHEVGSMSWGKLSEMKDDIALSEKLQKRLMDILAERSTLTAKKIQNKTARTDWWLTAEEALAFGFIDEVR